MIRENVMTDVKTKYVPSPVGNVVQIYDIETDMYLGHIVYCGRRT